MEAYFTIFGIILPALITVSFEMTTEYSLIDHPLTVYAGRPIARGTSHGQQAEAQRSAPSAIYIIISLFVKLAAAEVTRSMQRKELDTTKYEHHSWRSPALTSPKLPARRACKLVAPSIPALRGDKEAYFTIIGIILPAHVTVTLEMMDYSSQVKLRTRTRPAGLAVRSPALTSLAPEARRAWTLVAHTPSMPIQRDGAIVGTDLAYIDLPFTFRADKPNAKMPPHGRRAQAQGAVSLVIHGTIPHFVKPTEVKATRTTQHIAVTSIIKTNGKLGTHLRMKKCPIDYLDARSPALTSPSHIARRACTLVAQELEKARGGTTTRSRGLQKEGLHARIDGSSITTDILILANADQPTLPPARSDLRQVRNWMIIAVSIAINHLTVALPNPLAPTPPRGGQQNAVETMNYVMNYVRPTAFIEMITSGAVHHRLPTDGSYESSFSVGQRMVRETRATKAARREDARRKKRYQNAGS